MQYQLFFIMQNMKKTNKQLNQTKLSIFISPSANRIMLFITRGCHSAKASQSFAYMDAKHPNEQAILVKECGFGSLLISTFNHSSLSASYGILQELNSFKSQLQTLGKQNNHLSIRKGIC